MPKKRPSVPAPRTSAWIFLILVCITLLTYAPAWHGGVLWDDDGHLTRVDLRSLHGLARIWTEIGATQQYYPLVHSLFWVMFQLWGMQTLGYHLVNILLHATSAFLIARLLRRLDIPGAIPAAIVFAVHPVHVESVAWMTELKNTLSGVLALASLLTYLRFDAARARRTYLLSLLLFTLALLAKSAVATLPVVIAIILWWQRGRLDSARDLRPLAPFVALGVAAGMMTAWFEHALIGARGAEFNFSIVERGLIAGRALWFYLGKLIWPAPLTFIYPRWTIDASIWWQYLFPLAMLAALGVCWRLRATTRAPLAALLIFAVTLAPALGFVNIYPFRYSFVADHFQYLASIAIITLVVAGLHRALSSRAGSSARADAMLAIVLGAPLAVLAWQQSHDYVNAEALYRATIARNPACWMAMHNLATLKLAGSDADLRDAVTLTEQSLALNPGNAEAHNTLALALQRQGRIDEALLHLNESARLAPTLSVTRNNLGVIAFRLGRLEEAEQRYREAIALNTSYAEAHRNLGLVFQQRGQVDNAAAEFELALSLDPSSVEAHADLGTARMRQGRVDDAVREYAEAVKMMPELADLRVNFGLALERANRPADAEAQYREAIRLRPEDSKTLYRLANSLSSTGKNPEAVTYYRRALALEPGAQAAAIHNDLGVALATSGDLKGAIAEFREALRLDPDLQDAKDNLRRAGVSRKP